MRRNPIFGPGSNPRSDRPELGGELEAALEAKLEDDPALAEELAGLVEEAKAAGLTVQTAVQIGDENRNVQIVGDKNRVDSSRR